MEPGLLGDNPSKPPPDCWEQMQRGGCGGALVGGASVKLCLARSPQVG